MRRTLIELYDEWTDIIYYIAPHPDEPDTISIVQKSGVNEDQEITLTTKRVDEFCQILQDVAGGMK